MLLHPKREILLSVDGSVMLISYRLAHLDRLSCSLNGARLWGTNLKSFRAFCLALPDRDVMAGLSILCQSPKTDV